LIIETYGNASAQHPFDLGTADLITSARAGYIDNLSGGAVALASNCDAKSSDIKTMTDKIGVITNTGGTATIGAILGNPSNTSHSTTLAKFGFDGSSNVNALIKAQDNIDFGALQKASITAAVPSVANILAGVIEGTLTVQQALRLTVSGLAGKLSGGGTSTLTFRDTTDAKNRITATVDANGNRTAITTDVT
jgi:hypothetical protein